MSKSDWKFSQVFGERSHNDPVEYVDIISAIEFEGRGDYLATGDHGGRVVLFERVNGKNPHSQKELEKMDQTAEVHPKYVYKTEFQSHVPEFDYLKSLDIEEKINKLRWCASPNDSLLMLSTNDKTIKLWKVLEHKAKKVKQMVQMDVIPHVNTENALLAEKSFVGGPNASSVANDFHLEWINKKLESTSPIYQEGSRMSFNTGDGVSSRCRRVYAHAHDYNINSISNNSDGETFISADDLKINLWNMEISNQCFNIINMKPDNMEDLVEVITSAEFHPAYCNLLAYSSSRGFIRLADMRQSALCDQHARILQDYDVYGSKSFFAEIASSISDMKFTKDGRYILSRDYMNLKLWDLNMERSPVATFKIHEHLRPQLTELYNSDAIFDKFDCCLSRDGRHFASGSYSNTFKIFSSDDGPNGGIALEASRTPNRISEPQPALKAPRLFTSFSLGHNRRGHDTPSFESNGIPYDLKSKLIHLAWHPTANTIACAASNSLYMYHS